MQKLTAILIFTGYVIYFLLTPLFTIHDEGAQVNIVVGFSQNKYIYISGEKSKDLNAIKKVAEKINFIESPFRLPEMNDLKSVKVENNDFNLEGVYSHQAYSPPLYYILASIFFRVSQISEYLFVQFYFLRIFSAIFYFGSVFMAWKILNIFFKNKKSACSVLIFFSLNPILLKMGIGVNPDIAVTFFSLWFLFILLKSQKASLNFQRIFYLSFLSVLSSMSKISGIFTNLTFVAYIFLNYGFNKKSLIKIGIFEIIFLIFTSPWFIFAKERYNTFFPQIFLTHSFKIDNLPLISKIIDTFTAFRYTIMSYSGFMGEGWPHPFKTFFLIYGILFVILSLIGVLYVLKQKKTIYKTSFIFLSSLVLFLIVMSAGFRIKQLDLDVQGRYLLPAFFVICLYIYFGILAIVKKEKLADLIIRGFAIFQYIFILITVLILRYYV